MTTRAYPIWRGVHLAASWTLALVAIAHSALTVRLYSTWTPDAVWFLGTGLGLLLLAATNLAHVGIEPCAQPTARLVRLANWAFFLFGIGAVVAVPEPQAVLVLLALLGQAVAAHWTLPGTA